MSAEKPKRKTESIQRVGSVEYEHVGSDYLEKRSLSKIAGWVLLWGLGVGAVITGNYFGWNFGLSAGGFWGVAIATIFMAIMYTAMMYSLTELSTALPYAGGPYSYCPASFWSLGWIFNRTCSSHYV